MNEALRYSDKDLTEFKKLIEEKILNAEKDLKHFQGQIDYSGNNSGDETGKKLGSMEDGSEALGREKIAQLAHRQRKFIQQLKAAIVRIENKTYGVCRQTGKLISKQRLNIVPHTTLSIEAKNAQQQEY
ncbi:MAG: molecular chaperone DnaK [Flavobacteriales bacterium]|nr:molecular chaperone DnaK [Flavobacteriales bacterium]|tara:strand:- start:2485 stop:2871 length:387 start_codon:yes stop_codon:yes gene_type:complete